MVRSSIISNSNMNVSFFSIGIMTGFILNLENLEIGHFYKKSGKTWNSQGTFYNFYPSQGKSGKTKYLVYISFSLTISIVVRKVVALIFASECELYHLV